MDKRAFEKLRILVADPSSYMSGLTRNMLRGIDLKLVTEFNTATAALEALKRGTFDAIVVDDALTPIDGVELTRQLRKLEGNPNRTIPVIMVFAVAEESRILAARDAGVTEFIRKPMSAQVLESRLRQAVGSPRAFVEAEVYVGPDRRRRTAGATPKRRAVDKT